MFQHLPIDTPFGMPQIVLYNVPKIVPGCTTDGNRCTGNWASFRIFTFQEQSLTLK